MPRAHSLLLPAVLSAAENHRSAAEAGTISSVEPDRPNPAQPLPYARRLPVKPRDDWDWTRELIAPGVAVLVGAAMLYGAVFGMVGASRRSAVTAGAYVLVKCVVATLVLLSTSAVTRTPLGTLRSLLLRVAGLTLMTDGAAIAVLAAIPSCFTLFIAIPAAVLVWMVLQLWWFESESNVLLPAGLYAAISVFGIVPLGHAMLWLVERFS
jgi:hypothetical protein